MFKETYRLFLVKLFSAFLGFVLSATIARKLPIDEVGEYFFLLSLVSFVMPIALAGMGHSILYNFKRSECNVNSLVGFSIFTTVFISIVSGFILICLLDAFYFESSLSLELNGIIILIIIFNSLCELISYIYQSLRRSWFGSLIVSSKRQALIISCVIFFDVDSVYQLLYIYFYSSLFSFFVAYICMVKDVKPQYDKIISNLFQIKKSWTFFLNHFMGTLNGSILPLMIGFFSTSSQVAYFAVALKIVSLSAFILLPINRVVAPRYSAFFASEDLDGIKETAKFSARISFSLSVPLLLFMFIFVEDILSYFGDDYVVSSKDIFYVLLFGQAINCLSGSVGWLLQMTGEEKLYRNISFFNIILALFLGFIFIPIQGALGAAVIYSLSLFVTNVISSLYVKKVYSINIYKFW